MKELRTFNYRLSPSSSRRNTRDPFASSGSQQASGYISATRTSLKNDRTHAYTGDAPEE